MKKIMVVSDGDPNSIDTWSNVPYYLVNTLQKKGWEVFTVSVGASSKFENILVRGISYLIRLLFCEKKSIFSIKYTAWYKRIKEKKVQKLINANPEIACIVYVGEIPMYFPITEAKVIVFCDFTIEYTIRKLQGREPTRLEQKQIMLQDKTIKQFDDIVVMFQDAYAHFISYYSDNKNIFRPINGHFINSDNLNIKIEDLRKEKLLSNRYLFIGRIRYKKGILTAINTVEKYNLVNEKKIYLDIIGVTADQIGLTSNYVRYFGYLSKSIDTEKMIYYKCISNARAVLNTSMNWGGMSSTVEAMMYGTPVITSRYDEFINLFGSNIDFGYYAEPENVDSLYECIEKMQNLDTDSYQKLVDNSRNQVKNWTWDNCLDQVLGISEESLIL